MGLLDGTVLLVSGATQGVGAAVARAAAAAGCPVPSEEQGYALLVTAVLIAGSIVLSLRSSGESAHGASALPPKN